jgi:hypothetical protein
MALPKAMPEAGSIIVVIVSNATNSRYKRDLPRTKVYHIKPLLFLLKKSD